MCNYSQYVFEKGYQRGLQRSIFGFISTLMEMGSQKDFIVSKVAEKCQLTMEEAQEGDPICVFTASAGTMVVAAASGTVTAVNDDGEYGHNVWIDHGNGYVTRYAHLSDVKAVRGRRVKRGDVLGSVGMSGKSFAPHLHYEIWRDSTALDPVSYFFSSVTPEEYSAMLLLSASAGQSMD